MYRFETIEKHNFLSIVKRRAVHLCFSLLVFFIAERLAHYFMPQKAHWHYWALLLGEAIYVIALISEDFVNTVEINLADQKVIFTTYSFTLGTSEIEMDFDKLKLRIEDEKKQVKEIAFTTKKQHLSLQRKKDKFSKDAMNAIRDILTSMVSKQPFIK